MSLKSTLDGSKCHGKEYSWRLLNVMKNELLTVCKCHENWILDGFKMSWKIYSWRFWNVMNNRILDGFRASSSHSWRFKTVIKTYSLDGSQLSWKIEYLTVKKCQRYQFLTLFTTVKKMAFLDTGFNDGFENVKNTHSWQFKTVKRVSFCSSELNCNGVVGHSS